MASRSVGKACLLPAKGREGDFTGIDRPRSAWLLGVKFRRNQTLQRTFGGKDVCRRDTDDTIHPGRNTAGIRRTSTTVVLR